jgi:hypothetical protein
LSVKRKKGFHKISFGGIKVSSPIDIKINLPFKTTVFNNIFKE